MSRRISQNPTKSEENALLDGKQPPSKVTNLANFADQKAVAKSSIQSLVRHICREVNRQKFNYSQIKYIFRLVREQCHIEVPSHGSRQLIELPTTDELSQFYGSVTDPVHRLIFETLEETGLRVSELCGLQVNRIDFSTNLVFVSQGKGKKDRVTVVGNRLKEKLQLYLEGRNNKYLFESNRHTRFSSRRIEQLCAHYLESSGIPKKLTPHTFRHLWNTKLAEAGLTEEKRALLAGHDGDDTQKIYTHLAAGGFKSEVIAILDRLAGQRR